MWQFSCTTGQPERTARPAVGRMAGTLLIAVAVFAGCEGPQGPQGEGINELDMTSPEVIVTRPGYGETVYSDTFHFGAVASDNDTVSGIEFLVDGTEITGSFLAQQAGQVKYGVNWRRNQTPIEIGAHVLQARARDASGNEGYSPPLLFYREPIPAQDTIAYFADPFQQGFEFDVMRIPDVYGDRYWNVRFSPLDSCQVLQVVFNFSDPSQEPGVDGPCDIRIHFWESTDELLPGTAVDSFDVGGDTLNFDTSVFFDVEDLDLIFEGDFHVGFSPFAENYAQYLEDNLGMAIGVTIDPERLADGDTHRSIEYDGIEDPEGEQTEAGWRTMYNNYGEEKRDLHILVLVRYHDGSTAWVPDPGAGRRGSLESLTGR
ncbi:hypothetical protein GF324_10910 [bacterium]|nr:hypothetical protein [bacterium]